MKYAVLVYQAGLANVFQVECLNMADFGRDAKRLAQGSFKECENIARGIALAGVPVASAHCNECGDIAKRLWDADLESAPFRDSMRPVYHKVARPDEFTEDGEIV